MDGNAGVMFSPPPRRAIVVAGHYIARPWPHTQSRGEAHDHTTARTLWPVRLAVLTIVCIVVVTIVAASLVIFVSACYATTKWIEKPTSTIAVKDEWILAVSGDSRLQATSTL